MTKNRTSSATAIKVYSQNVCCLPYGGRERYLQTGSALGAVLMTCLFLVGCAMPSWRYYTLAIYAILLSSWLVAACCFFSTLWVVALSTIFAHDYKLERLSYLVQKKLLNKGGKPEYDVVLLQECYGCTYSDEFRRKLVVMMKEAGYDHQYLPPCGLGQTLPSLWCNSGLAVFSRHPIKEIKFRPFQNRLFYDFWCVQRGVLAAKLDVGGSDMWVASTHFGPPVDVLEAFKSLPRWLQNILDKYDGQLGELRDLIGSWKEEGVEGIVAGDFNAIVHGKQYKMLKRELGNVGMKILWDGFEKEDCPTTVNPLEDRALTGGGRTPMVLDFIFASSGLEGDASIGDVVVKGKNWECISDHNPIIGNVRVKRKEGG